jgi:hypothetical protein
MLGVVLVAVEKMLGIIDDLPAVLFQVTHAVQDRQARSRNILA